jgi:hypothetical protein
VALIRAGSDVAAVAAATSAAAEASMIDASNDPAVRHSFWLLTQIPVAARSAAFEGELRDRGLKVSNPTSIADIAVALVEAVDRTAARQRTDYGEMATLAAGESLYSIVASEPLLLPEAASLQETLAGLASPKRFAILARDFFSRLTRRHFAYFLSRELANHVGPGRRFTTIREHDEFDTAFDVHCRETSRIIKEFAAEWFSKHNHEGGIDPAKAGRFVSVAAKKLRDELVARRASHA